MSDFDAVFTDPEEEVAEEATEPAEAEPEVEPEASPEEAPSEESPRWKAQGFDSEEDWDKAVSDLAAWRKELARTSSEQGRLRKQKPTPAPTDTDDPLADLPPEDAQKLRALIQSEAAKVVNSTFGAQAQVAEEMFNTSAERLFKETADSQGLSSEALYEFMDSHDLFPEAPSLKELAGKLELAAAAMKGRDIDTIVESKLAERLADLKKKGGEVKAVSPAKAVVSEPEPEDDEANLTFSQLLVRPFRKKD